MLQVRCLEPLKAGTELCVTYVNLLERREVRIETLQQSKHFTCTCAR